jgi:hypothetical protein
VRGGPYADARAVEQMSQIGVVRRITAAAGKRLQAPRQACHLGQSP